MLDRMGQLDPAPADPGMIAPAHADYGIFRDLLPRLGDLAFAQIDEARHHQRLRTRTAFREASGHQQLVDTLFSRHERSR